MVFSQDFMTDVRRWGWRRKFYAVLMSKLSRWIVFCRIICRDLEGEAQDADDSPAEQRFATKDDLLAFADKMPAYMQVWALEPDPDEHNQCWAAFIDDQMVAMAWRAYQHAPMKDGLMVGFEKPYRYGLNSYTLPEHRGQHLLVSRASDPYCREKGYFYNLAFIDTHNYASLTRSYREGARPAGFAGYFKLGRLIIPFRTPAARRHTFRFYKPQQPAAAQPTTEVSLG